MTSNHGALKVLSEHPILFALACAAVVAIIVWERFVSGRTPSPKNAGYTLAAN